MDKVAICYSAVLLLAILTSVPHVARSAPAETAMQEQTLASIPVSELESIIRQKMPLPVLRILHGRQLGLDRFAVEMSMAKISGAPSQAIHVTFHTPVNCDRSVMMEAVGLAAAAARGKVESLGLKIGGAGS